MTDRGVPPANASADPWEHAAPRAAEEAVAQLRRLEAATASLSGARTPDAVAEAALSAGLRAIGASRGFVLVPDGGGNVLGVLRTAGVDVSSATHAARDGGASPWRDAWRSGAPVFVPDRAALVERYPALAQSMAGNAVAALPLVAGEQTLGILAAAYDAPRAFEPVEQVFAAAVARRCGEALECARMYVAERLARAEAVAAHTRLGFLDRLSGFLAAASDEAEVLAGVVRLAVPALADWAGVLVPDRDGSAPHVVAAAGAELLGVRARELLAADPEGALATTLAGLRPVALAPAGDGPRALAVAGVGARGAAVGALVLASEDPGRRYGASDLGLLADVAHRTGLAVGHVRMLRDAHRAVRLREDFLHVASHELRGPLGTLRIGLQLAAREIEAGASGAARQRLGMAQRQVERMVRLAERLLDVSRITSGRLEIDRRPGDLAALARDVAEQLSDEAAAAGCPLTLHASGPVRFPFDPDRLEDVLVNLLTNAFKYGRGAPVTIVVAQRGPRAVLEVHDRGIGIAPADRERIFERFERAVSARNHPGFGLGLWIVRRLAEAHGGTVHVEGEPGAGSRFVVELPTGEGDRRSPGSGAIA